jgi:hypothetical protein
MRRVAARKADLRRVFSGHAVNRVRVHAPGGIERLGIAAHRTVQRAVHVIAVPGLLKIGPDSLCGLRIDRQCFACVWSQEPLSFIQHHIEDHHFRVGLEVC